MYDVLRLNNQYVMYKCTEYYVLKFSEEKLDFSYWEYYLCNHTK